MGNKIIILDDNLISKIAAGEVVERPFSVVKELVENSIDAGASQISVEIKNGGKDLIRVIDNGCGMTMEEAKLSLERHSTSKIRTADDLFNIKTLGFRGEALPSIASVSKLEILTRINDSSENNGNRIEADGGNIKKQEDFGCPAGTTITVNKLFFNTPARLKFLKSSNTELSHIINIISKFILSRPDISFRLINDGNEVFSSPGSGKLVDSIASVYGVDIVDSLVEVSSDEGSKIDIHGYVSKPVISKSDRDGESFYVNGRYIRNALLSRSIEDSYRNLIPNNKYPVAVIFLDIDPSKIDVNVHPAKREIKFERPDEALNAIRRSVSKALSNIKAGSTAYTEELTIGNKQDHIGTGSIEMFDRHENIAVISPSEAFFQVQDGIGAVIQIAYSYIIVVKDNELLLIDQHAAHERVLYERFKSKEISGSQKLLINITVELVPSEIAVLQDNLDYLAELGFELEAFGKNTYAVRAIPIILEYNQAKGTIVKVLSELVDALKIRDTLQRKDEVLKMLACKGAIKAGDRLSFDEMNNLVKDILKVENSATCPHGRPTVIRLTTDELAKMFKRK